MNRYARILIVLLIVLSESAIVWAQLPSGSSSKPHQVRPPESEAGLYELAISGGELFLDLFRDQQAQPTVDHPKWNSQDSPRKAVLTFLEAMDHVTQGRDKAWPRAQKLFPEVEAEDLDRKTVAQDLMAVFDRLPEIAPSTLPDKKTAEDLQISIYEIFPRGIEVDWLYSSLKGAPDGNIVIEKKEDRWQFTPTTMQSAQALRESLKTIPPRKRINRGENLFLNVVGPTFTDTPWLNWLWFLFCLTAGIATAWGVHRLLTRLITSLRNTADRLLSPLLGSMRFPTSILLVTLGFMIGSARLTLDAALSQLRWDIVEILLLIAGTWLLVSLLELLIIAISWTMEDGKNDHYEKMFFTVLRRLIRLATCIMLGLFILQNLFSLNITALLGGVGLIALALSLAAKDAVQNLFGALTVFFNRPFLVGDWIIFEDQIGEVEDVSIQVTRIRLLTGELWAVPNMKFVTDPVQNLSLRKYLRRTLELAITYDSSVDQLDQSMSILKEILTDKSFTEKREIDLEAHPPHINFAGFQEDYLKVRADHWYMMGPEDNDLQRDTERGWFSYLEHCSQIDRSILKRFNEAEIDFAFPTQTLYLANDKKRGLRAEIETTGQNDNSAS